MGTTTAIVLFWLAAVGALYLFVQGRAIRRRSRDRVFAAGQESAEADTFAEVPGGLAGWLYRAGYRSPDAVRVFLSLACLALALGGAAAWAVYASGMVGRNQQLLGRLSGGVGDALRP